MKSLVILCVMATCASAQLVVPGPVAYRAPSYDSAIIQSHRLGGNFAYSTSEAHAYAVQTPVIGQQIVPVGATYVQGAPIVKSSTGFITQQIPQYAYAYPQFGGFNALPYAYNFGHPLIAVPAPAAPAAAEAAPAAPAAAPAAAAPAVEAA